MNRILLVIMTVLSVAGADACNHKTYKIDFCGQEFAFVESKDESRKSEEEEYDPWLKEHGLMPARTERKAGETVELYYWMVATDTDYRFILDGVEVRPDYKSPVGYIIRFTMPEHDVTLRCLQRNSMREISGPWE